MSQHTVPVATPRLVFALVLYALAVAARPARAVTPAAGTWAVTGELHDRVCDAAGRCSTGPTRALSRTFQIAGPGFLPTPGPLVPCQTSSSDLAEVAHYVASPVRPRRFALHIVDRRGLLALFRACAGPSLRITRMSSVITLTADGQRSVQRDVLKFSAVGSNGARAFVTVAGRLTGELTGPLGSLSRTADDNVPYVAADAQ